MHWPLSDFLTASLAGALVICVFSWDQLNRPSYGHAKELARMLELLAPADIRSWDVFLRAYLVYTSFLLAIYTVLGLVGEGLLDQLLTQETTGDRGADGTTPLYVSLVMVGLIPNAGIKGFSTIEAKLRRLAHRSVGIPDSLFSRRDIMVGIPLKLDDLGDAVIGSAERRRIAERLRDARAGLGRGEKNRIGRLEQALVKIIAYRSWVFDHGVWPGEMLRGRFARLESEIQREIGALDVELDVLAAASRLQDRDGGDGEAVAELLAAGPGTGLVDEATRRRAIAERWQAAVINSEETAKQVCVLMMLYLERSSELPQGDEVADSLGRYLHRVREDERRTMQDFDLMAIVAITITLAMAMGGVGASLLGIVEHSSTLLTAFNYAFTALLTYGVAMVVAVSRRSKKIERRLWSNVAVERPLRIVPLARTSLVAGAVSVSCLALYNLLSSLLAPGADWVYFSENLGRATMSALANESPRLLLAAVQAAFFVVALDVVDAGPARNERQAWSRHLPWIHALALFVAGALVYEHRASGGAAPDQWYALLYAGSLAGLVGGLTSLSVLRLLYWPEVRDDDALAGI